MGDLILKNIEFLGDEYIKEFLSDWNKNKLEKEWCYALEFFFSHSFMRGRKDELSDEYYDFTMEVLKEFLGGSGEDAYLKLLENKELFDCEIIKDFKNDHKMKGTENSLNNEFFKEEIAANNSLINQLITKKEINKKRVHLGSDKDIIMVLDILRFITSLGEKKNIYVYFKKLMQEDGVKTTCNELIKFQYIADKIATFIIRDIVLLNPQIKFKDFDFDDAFPVDTWVAQIAEKLGYNGGKNDLSSVKEFFMQKCGEENINIPKFAAGAWYLGSNSLDIMLNTCLGEIDFHKVYRRWF